MTGTPIGPSDDIIQRASEVTQRFRPVQKKEITPAKPADDPFTPINLEDTLVSSEAKVLPPTASTDTVDLTGTNAQDLVAQEEEVQAGLAPFVSEKDRKKRAKQTNEPHQRLKQQLETTTGKTEPIAFVPQDSGEASMSQALEKAPTFELAAEDHFRRFDTFKELVSVETIQTVYAKWNPKAADALSQVRAPEQNEKVIVHLGLADQGLQTRRLAKELHNPVTGELWLSSAA